MPAPRSKKRSVMPENSQIEAYELFEILRPVFDDVATSTELQREFATALTKLADTHISREEMNDHKTRLVSLFERLLDLQTKNKDGMQELVRELSGEIGKTHGRLDIIENTLKGMLDSERDNQEHEQELEKIEVQHKNKVKMLLWTAVAGGSGIAFLLLERIFGIFD